MHYSIRPYLSLICTHLDTKIYSNTLHLYGLEGFMIYQNFIVVPIWKTGAANPRSFRYALFKFLVYFFRVYVIVHTLREKQEGVRAKQGHFGYEENDTGGETFSGFLSSRVCKLQLHGWLPSLLHSSLHCLLHCAALRATVDEEWPALWKVFSCIDRLIDRAQVIYIGTGVWPGLVSQ
jgi:hypothetical protein